jgi:hypothetical protein
MVMPNADLDEAKTVARGAGFSWISIPEVAHWERGFDLDRGILSGLRRLTVGDYLEYPRWCIRWCSKSREES